MNLQIILYDITAEEVAADLSSTDNLEETGLYRLLIELPALDLRTTAPSAIIGNYTFEQTPPHADLLGRIAKIAAAAQAPFIAAIGTDVFEKKKPEEIHPLVAESWAALRALPHAAYLGLTVPRFMLRWPFGAKTEPIDPFPFEEFTPHFGLKGFLWGNSANLAGLLLGKTFSEQGMGGMELGSIMVQGDLPLYFFTDKDGDQIALPCTERLASEAVAAHVIGQGFMPLLWMRGRPEVRLGSLGAVNGARLAGPWAPVATPPDPVEAPAVAATTTVAADLPQAETSAEQVEPPTATPEAAPGAPAEPEAAAAAESGGVDELDDLLGDLESQEEPQAPEAAPEPVSGALAPGEDAPVGDSGGELHALLASIEGAGQTDDEDAEEGAMDPDLAALLADL